MSLLSSISSAVSTAKNVSKVVNSLSNLKGALGGGGTPKIPTPASLAAAGGSKTPNNYVPQEFKVRLAPISVTKTATTAQDLLAASVIFNVTPTLQESGSVEYSPISPVHMPGSIQVYKHTNSRTFDISAHLISRNVDDARANMMYLQLLRSWRFPYFGATDTTTAPKSGGPASATSANPNATAMARAKGTTTQLRGAPPEVLYLWAYSPHNDRTPPANSMKMFMNINKVPVVLTNLSITFADDTDYLPVFEKNNGGKISNTTQAFPIKMDISISLTETHSPREFEKFDLTSYRNGTLVGF